MIRQAEPGHKPPLQARRGKVGDTLFPEAMVRKPRHLRLAQPHVPRYRPGEPGAQERGTLLGGPGATVRQGPKFETVLTAREFQFDQRDKAGTLHAKGKL